MTLPGRNWAADPRIEERTHVALDLQDFDEVEFRASKTDPVEVMIAKRINFTTHGVSPPAEPQYSQDKYAFSPGNGGAARWIPDSVWERAIILNRGRVNQPASWSDESYHLKATYEGKSFERSGRYAYGSELSEHARLIAVFSYSGRQIPERDRREGSIILSGVGPDPATGYLFVDLYLVNSGVKVLGLFGPFSHGTPSTWTVLSYFLADFYFVVPAQTDYRGFVFCTVPASAGGKQ